MDKVTKKLKLENLFNESRNCHDLMMPHCTWVRALFIQNDVLKQIYNKFLRNSGKIVPNESDY